MESNNKRIAKNTLLLYVRMLFSMLVSLFTSRVVLATLGVEDYGTYNVVGGIVAMAGFLNASMAGATSRFLTFELGRGDSVRLARAFSSAMLIHVGIALAVLLLAETVGLWLLEAKLVIPEGRMVAARWVFQLSIVSTLVGITQTPYDACIVAHERMGIYAYVGILGTCLRLAIVYVLLVGAFDKLILYGVLTLAVALLLMSVCRVYCHRHFAEARFRLAFDREMLKPMLSFSLLDLYGNASVVARTQGVNVLMNMFFGPVVNAAAGIATQVQGAVMAFTNNVITAVRPQLVKQYASGKHDSLFLLLANSIKVTSLLMAALSVPLLCEMHFVLRLWLGDNVPEETVTFCFLTLLFAFFSNISILLVSVIHATGRIKRPSFINGTLYLMVVPVSYVAFKMGVEAWITYFFNVVALLFGLLSNAWTIHLYIETFPLRRFLIDFAACVALLALGYVAAYSVRCVCDEGLPRLALTTVVAWGVLLTVGYRLFPKPVRKEMARIIRNKVCPAH